MLHISEHTRAVDLPGSETAVPLDASSIVHMGMQDVFSVDSLRVWQARLKVLANVTL